MGGFCDDYKPKQAADTPYIALPIKKLYGSQRDEELDDEETDDDSAAI